MAAIREAVVNAFCHRNYSYHGGSVSFAIYDDRIEIWSYGELPSGMTLEKLMVHESLPRNPHIANTLYYHKYFESWGCGVQKIIRLCTEAGHPKPFYEINTGGLLLTMPSKQLIGGYSIETDHADFSNLTQRQIELIKALQNHDGMSTFELHAQLINPPSERTIFTDMDRLRKLRLIRGEGGTRMRRWYLTTK